MLKANPVAEFPWKLCHSASALFCQAEESWPAFHWVPAFMSACFEMIGFLIYFYLKPHIHDGHQNRLWNRRGTVSGKTSPTKMWAIKQNHRYLLILNATFSLPEESRVSQSTHTHKHTHTHTHKQTHTHTDHFVMMPIVLVFVFFNNFCLCMFFSANRFCVGDKFFLKNNMILCQMDYEEGQLNGSFETQVQ